MADPMGQVELVGRERELGIVMRWVDDLTVGPAGLAIEGQAGIGKSTLWRAALDLARAAGAQVLVSRPVEAELPYGYAALGDLLVGSIDPVLPKLPAPQGRALAVAMSIEAAPTASDPLLVGRALVTALRLLARDTPVVLAIDDAQWLDGPSARALAFAVRRLDGVRAGVAITVREGHVDPLDVAGALADRAERLTLHGLSLGATGRLLRHAVDPAMARLAVLRIHERSAGNPMFALDLARHGSDRLPASLEELVAARLNDVPEAARDAIELAAVLGPTPANRFVNLASLDVAIAASVLVADGEDVRFPHPLVAAAAYERIPLGRRRELHLRAAEAAQAAGNLEDGARHAALATAGPDDAVAQVVEDAARAARARGAAESAVALAGHALRLTSPTQADAMARRAMDKADYLFVAGDERGARAVVDELLAGGPSGAVRSRALVQRALTAEDAATAVADLEAAAKEPHDDAQLAARTLAQLAWQRGAWFGEVLPALDEARLAVAMAEALGDASTLVTALTTLGLISSLEGHLDAAVHFERALAILAVTPTAAGDHTPHMAYANERGWRGAFERAEELLDMERARAIAHGDDGVLMRVDLFRADLALRRGRWDVAARLLEDVLAEARDYWRGAALIRRAILRARRGESGASDDIEELRGMTGDDGAFVAAGDFAAGMVLAADGRVGEAAPLMQRFLELTDRSGSRGPAFAVLTPETVAVLVAAGRIPEAEMLTAQLDRRQDQLAPWGDAAAALCRGILATSTGAGAVVLATDLLDTARAEFEAIDAPWELGQTLLAQGMLLRRAGLRTRAGEALDSAVAIFDRLGAAPARQQALEELRRARPRPRSDDRLTAAEARVASLVAEGTSNRDVAARLFTTVATVEAHLTHIYAKLGIRSRTELARKVSDGSLTLEH